MRHDHHLAVPCSGANPSQHLRLRLGIDAVCCLVQDQDARFAKSPVAERVQWRDYAEPGPPGGTSLPSSVPPWSLPCRSLGNISTTCCADSVDFPQRSTCPQVGDHSAFARSHPGAFDLIPVSPLSHLSPVPHPVASCPKPGT